MTYYIDKYCNKEVDIDFIISEKFDKFYFKEYYTNKRLIFTFTERSDRLDTWRCVRKYNSARSQKDIPFDKLYVIPSVVKDMCSELGIYDPNSDIVVSKDDTYNFDFYKYTKSELMRDIGYLSKLTPDDRVQLVSSRTWVSVPILEAVRRCIFYRFPRTRYSRDLRNQKIGRYVNRLKHNIISGFWKDVGAIMRELELTGKDIFSMLVTIVGVNNISSRIPNGVKVEEVIDLTILDTVGENFVAIEDLESRVENLEDEHLKLRLEMEQLKAEIVNLKLVIQQLVFLLRLYVGDETYLFITQELERTMARIE
eukprot:TRINITY_DN8479_c0_g1_i2.p1 TRINITY_DN8479_c0_g1~~TRINITY_DN8479_c0_g1_i2.p1  ORF type:complete len:311 (+),score=25.43 TRINITY_DN8479_c0_g1_i2:152-1084(+)